MEQEKFDIADREAYADRIIDEVISRFVSDKERSFYNHAGEFKFSRTYIDMTQDLSAGGPLPPIADTAEYRNALKGKLLDPENGKFMKRSIETGKLIPNTALLYDSDTSNLIDNAMPCDLESLLADMEGFCIEKNVAESLGIDIDEIESPLSDYIMEYCADNEAKKEEVISCIQEAIEDYKYSFNDPWWQEDEICYMIESCNAFLKEQGIEQDAYLILGSGMTWRRLSGVKLVEETDSIRDVLDALSINSDYNLCLTFRDGDNMIEGHRYSHDEPTGVSFNIVPMGWIQEYIKDADNKKHVIQAMYIDDDIQDAVLTACPSIEPEFLELVASHEKKQQAIKMEVRKQIPDAEMIATRIVETARPQLSNEEVIDKVISKLTVCKEDIRQGNRGIRL